MPISSQVPLQNSNLERPKRTRRQPEKLRDTVPDGAWLSQGAIRTVSCEISVNAGVVENGSSGGCEIAAAGGSEIAAAGESEVAANGRSGVAAAGGGEVAAAGGSEVAAAGGCNVAAAGVSVGNCEQAAEEAAQIPQKIEAAAWGELKGHALVNSVSAAYLEVVRWRRNVFNLPKGKAGEDFIEELTKIYRHFNDSTAFESIALTLSALIFPLLLQKPAPTSKARDHRAIQNPFSKRSRDWQNN